MSLHWFQRKLGAALVVVALHPMIGARRARGGRGAGDSVDSGEPNGCLREAAEVGKLAKVALFSRVPRLRARSSP